MGATTVMSIRLPSGRVESLKRLARRLDRSASETAARLVDEGLRRAEFALIEFRDTLCGRQAYLQGSRMAVWQVVALCRNYKNDVPQTAKHLNWPTAKVQAALNYAEAFPEEIENALEDSRSFDFTKLSRLLPALEKIEVPASALKAK